MKGLVTHHLESKYGAVGLRSHIQSVYVVHTNIIFVFYYEQKIEILESSVSKIVSLHLQK